MVSEILYLRLTGLSCSGVGLSSSALMSLESQIKSSQSGWKKIELSQAGSTKEVKLSSRAKPKLNFRTGFMHKVGGILNQCIEIPNGFAKLSRSL